jgi:hypothetical protein
MTGIVKPQADIVTLSNSVKYTVLTLGKSDVLIFCGGVNDISKNNSKMGLRHIFNFVKKMISIPVLFYLVYPMDRTWKIDLA